mmetsp:Transcript_9780/g.21863  ORF Transcript_9780/g.21863 Transcript_9780/m.21863 type:complete len:211 (+) Transcript_9780:384-1016(+)
MAALSTRDRLQLRSHLTCVCTDSIPAFAMVGVCEHKKPRAGGALAGVYAEARFSAAPLAWHAIAGVLRCETLGLRVNSSTAIFGCVHGQGDEAIAWKLAGVVSQSVHASPCEAVLRYQPTSGLACRVRSPVRKTLASATPLAWRTNTVATIPTVETLFHRCNLMATPARYESQMILAGVVAKGIFALSIKCGMPIQPSLCFAHAASICEA